MFQVVVILFDAMMKQLAPESIASFGSFGEAEGAAMAEIERVRELAGVSDWTVNVLAPDGSHAASWCMDDAQSPYEHGILIRDNFDAMFYLTRTSSD